MPKNMNTLKEIANTKPKKQPKKKEPTPKELRAVEIESLGDWLIWIEITKERSNKELVTEEKENEMLGIIQNQFSELAQIQKALARLMTNYTELTANEKYINYALTHIFKNLDQLEKIERLTNKGGRKRNKEIYEIANAECLSWFSKTGRKPSATKLTSLVEFAITSKKGEGRKDGNSYLSLRSSSDFLRQWQPPSAEFNRQELVKSFAN
jgi:hypothetical protein